MEVVVGTVEAREEGVGEGAVPVIDTEEVIVGASEEAARGMVGAREDRTVAATEGSREGAVVLEVIAVVVVVGMVVEVVVRIAVGEAVEAEVTVDVGIAVALVVGEAVGEDVFVVMFVGMIRVGDSEGYPTTPLVGAPFVLWLANKEEVGVAPDVGLEVG